MGVMHGLAAAVGGLVERLASLRRPRMIGILALVLPFVVAPLLSSVICRGVGHELAGWLAWIAWVADPAPATSEASEASEPAPKVDEADLQGDPAIESIPAPESMLDPMSAVMPSSGRTAASPRGRSRVTARPTREAQQVTRPAGLDVSADVVRSAIPPGTRPSGVLVQANASHPGGVEVRNPGILGGYIQPGDVVVEIEGQRIASWSTVIGVVTRAYAHHADSVHGKLWRRGRDLGVTVHLPYEQAFDARGRGTK